VPGTILSFNARFDLELDRYASVEAQAAAIADDIAYDAHDIDDGLRAGLISLDMLEDVSLPAGILASVRQRYPGLDAVRTGHELMRRQITAMVEDAIATAQANLDRLAPQSVADIHGAGRPMVAFSPAMTAAEKELKAFLYGRLYRHPAVMAVREGADQIVRDLYTRYFERPADLPDGHGEEATVCSEAERARYVADFIAGMTDTYAIKEHRRLFDRTPDLV
jgi:dGTPase